MTDSEQVLRSVDVLADFPHEFLERCARVSELRTYAKGETVVSENEPAKAFFVLTKGRLEVIREDTGAIPLP